jgi:PAT family beta-lactamase induction signal transducer AmpG
MWPWSLKPLWGPVLEMFKTKKHFVVATQFIGGVSFGLLALTLPLDGFFQYSLALLAIIAFNSATHDISADGLYINSLSHESQSRYVGWQGAFYNIAKVLAQGVLVYVAGRLEGSIGVVNAWMIVMGCFGLILVFLAAYHTKVLPSGGSATGVRTLHEAFSTFWDVVRTFFRKEKIVWGILFIVLYRTAEGQVVKILPLFLRAARAQGGLGLSTSEIGIIYGTFGAAAFVLGSILGGYFAARLGLRKALFPLCCFFNIPMVVYVFLAFEMPANFFVICGAIVFEYFGYGFGFVGLILFMMQQIAPGRYQMAHYAFATALMNVGFMLPSMLSGVISDLLGYRNFFLWVLVATIPSFLVAWLVPFRNTAAEGESV